MQLIGDVRAANAGGATESQRAGAVPVEGALRGAAGHAPRR
jgi:hypothetical protein